MFKIPLVYRLGIGVLALAAIIGIPYYMGYNKAADKYKAKIAEYVTQKEDLQSKLDAALADVREVIVTKYVDKIRVIREKEIVYRDQAINIVPSHCELSAGWVYLHDASARGTDADPARSADEATSGVKDNQALGTITENYSNCNKNIEQINSLREFIIRAEEEVKKQNEAAKEATKKKKRR